MRLALAAVALVSALPAVAEPQKILLGPHIGDATILDLQGINSDHAVVRFRRELDDEIEECSREAGDAPSPKQVAACAKQGMEANRGRIYTRRAYCSASTIYTEFGNYSMVNHENEPNSNFDGKIYKPVRTDWKSHSSGEIVGNCSACNTPQLLSTFEVLCPLFYRSMFSDREPY